MLDVHPPHHAANTWRDFFIHIATIVIGLLIAIGLEQTVELIHHASERREVISALRQEAEGNALTLHTDIDILISEADWSLAAIKVLQLAPAKAGIVRAMLPQHKGFGHNTQPNRSAWTLSTSNGKAALLPEARARSYELMDRAAAQVLTATEARNTAYVAQHELELRLHAQFVPGATLSIPESEVPAVVERLASRATALQWEAARDAILIGYCEAVARDISDPREVGNLVGKEATAVQERTVGNF